MKKVTTLVVVFVALLCASFASALDHKEIQKNDVENIEKTIDTIHNNGYSKYEEEYLAVRLKVIEKEGVNSAGRNIVLDGKENGSEASTSEVKEAIDELNLILHPPAPEPTVTETTTTTPTTTTTSSVENSTVQCESGGDYSIDTGNGYYGGYQFDSGTWDTYGDPAYEEANLAPPAVQDAAAASVPYDAWPNC